MTLAELAERFDRLAQAIRQGPLANATIPGQKPKLDGEYAVGAALLWAYQRDLLTAARKETFSRDELLVWLETISRDSELFPAGVMELIADCEEETL